MIQNRKAGLAIFLVMIIALAVASSSCSSTKSGTDIRTASGPGSGSGSGTGPNGTTPGGTGELNSALVVSPDSGAWVKTLLENHGVSVTVVGWSAATVEYARGFDLVIVTGSGRTINEGEVVKGYDRPVLGLGPYGHVYFGILDLKNGSPYS
ncbi:MAG: hypothetical protein E3J72_15465 [Planctomycetota bacterium]|nr:MAG: hypothetical protein E3J72_15465 [Planctomycetota bacterium]